jgi:hypothetical protein
MNAARDPSPFFIGGIGGHAIDQANVFQNVVILARDLQ